ncbi:MAG TPA: ATP-binding protein [Luteitalea sp.]|nr:ATP-binding protein [Luteitalea sp.]
MNEWAAPPADARVLLLTATRRDAATTTELLRGAQIPTVTCERMDDVVAELGRGASALVVAEEMLTPSWQERLAAVLATQPPWSDLPVLVLTHAGANSPVARTAVATLGNVTLLERPLRVATLLSAVASATRARQRQYQIRGHLEERQRAEAALREADRRKDEFIATLGHELRNPLSPMTSGLRLLQMPQVQGERAARIVEMMERQLSHMVRLVDDLLEVSRITRGLVDVRRDALDLVPILRDAVESCRESIDRASHALVVALPETPLPVLGDAVRLTQVFTNLLANAVKYTNAGGHIWLGARASDGRIRVSVKDDGIGLAPAHEDAIFDMFVQVDRSARRSQGGLGIGLTLVRSLVALHGGRVEAHSDGLGTGSEFIVDLPLASAARVKPAEPHGARRLVGKRILVVDDNRDAADTLSGLLEVLGATVAVAYDGRTALDEAAAFTPDTVLLDLGMPGMDGYEVARALRTREPLRHTHLVALTGWGQERDHRRTQEAGFDDHMVKPPDIDRLTAMVSAR